MYESDNEQMVVMSLSALPACHGINASRLTVTDLEVLLYRGSQGIWRKIRIFENVMSDI